MKDLLMSGKITLQDLETFSQQAKQTIACVVKEKKSTGDYLMTQIQVIADLKKVTFSEVLQGIAEQVEMQVILLRKLKK